jgi:hypothetical protein
MEEGGGRREEGGRRRVEGGGRREEGGGRRREEGGRMGTFFLPGLLFLFQRGLGLLRPSLLLLHPLLPVLLVGGGLLLDPLFVLLQSLYPLLYRRQFALVSAVI